MWVEIFRTGEHTDSSGKAGSYEEESLDKIAEIYNSKVNGDSSFEAPVVKGHPKTDDPAYGWVERLARRGKILMAKLKEVSPEFTEEIRTGKYRKISISLYPDMLLRHIGFLGASAPAVSELKPVKFTEAVDFISYESDSSNNQDDTADDRDTLILQMKQQIEELGKEKQIIEEENSKIKREFAEYEKDMRHKEFREFANSLIEHSAGSLITPAQAEDLIHLLEIAHNTDCQRQATGEFCEGESLVRKIKTFASSLKPVFNTAEFAEKPGTRNTNFNDFKDRNVQEDRMRLHERALELQGDTPCLTYEEAVAMARSIM